MFAKMRRTDREMTAAEASVLLEKGEYGILSTVGENRWPEGTPLSYAVMEGQLYFHGAENGVKICNLRYEPRVAFCVVGKTRAVYSDDFTAYYESVVVHGEAQEVVDPAEKEAALIELCRRYLPAHMDKVEKAMQAAEHTAVWKISMEHITGKCNRPMG